MTNDVDYVRLVLGDNARRAPCWAYVQDADSKGTVAFFGGSRVEGEVNPLRYDSERPHQFLIGEVIFRPRLVIATSALVGAGAGGLLTSWHDTDAMLADGEKIIDNMPK